MHPKTGYARSGELHIAYQVVGRGPLDLAYVPGWLSHVELAWEESTPAGEVLVSSTVKDLVSGSGIRFADRGSQALKDIPRRWQLFVADAVS